MTGQDHPGGADTDERSGGLVRELHLLALQVTQMSERVGRLLEVIPRLETRLTSLEHEAERRAGITSALGKVAATAATVGTIAGSLIGALIASAAG